MPNRILSSTVSLLSLRPFHERKFYIYVFSAWFGLLVLHTVDWSGPWDWLQKWHVWDAQWYYRMWVEGYGSDPKMLVFPPGYSMVVGGVSTLTSLSFGAAALVINLISLFVAALVLTETIADRFKIDRRSFFVFFLCGPTLYFVAIPYSDCLFLALFAFALRIGLKDSAMLTKKEWGWGAVLLLIMPWFRLVGYALATWVLLRRWFAITVPLALAGWIGLNAWMTGNPWHFIEMQNAFSMPEGNFIDGLRLTWDAFTAGIPNDQATRKLWFNVYFLPLFSIGLLLLAALWFAFRREWLLALTIVAVLFVTHNQAFWRSAVRYDMPLFPLVAVPLLTAMKSQHNRVGSLLIKRLATVVFWVLAISCFWLQTYFAGQARLGQWTF